MGPTASGKSLVAEWIADELDAVLVSADAFMVYRGFDIGTNKPLERSRYELLDICDPREQFGVGEFVRRAGDVVRRSVAAQRSVVVVGGTGLYSRALMEGWDDLRGEPDPELRRSLRARLELEGLDVLVAQLRDLSPAEAARIDLQNPQRVTRALERALSPVSEHVIGPNLDVPMFKVGVQTSIDSLNERISARAKDMLREGWKDEVLNLLEMGVPEDAPAFKAIGYSALAKAWRGELSWEDAEGDIVRRTIQYAKRQRTWLRSEPRLRMLNVMGPYSAISIELQGDLRLFLRDIAAEA
jgi:tRNA dimethylallyltransferase